MSYFRAVWSLALQCRLRFLWACQSIVNFSLTNVKVVKKLSWHLCNALSLHVCPKRLTTLCGGLCQWDCLLYVNYHIAFITHLLQPELLFLHLNGCRICVHLSLLENCLSLLSPNVAECVKCKFLFILFVYVLIQYVPCQHLHYFVVCLNL